MRIAFIGDLHLDSRTPISRIDNYRETSIRKLRSLLDLVIKENIDTVICTGDFFDDYTEPVSYLVEVAEILLDFKRRGITFYTIIGNHDLPHDNMEYFSGHALDLLIKSSLVQYLDILKFDNTVIEGLSFSMAKSDNKRDIDSTKTNILVMHYATENTVANGSIPLKDLLEYDIVISGHDHTYYEPLKHGKTIILRPGSFTRRTKDQQNLKRDIVVYALDTDSKKIVKLILPGVEAAENVFRNDVFLETVLDLYNNSYNKVFNEAYFNSEAQDVFKIINELPLLVTDKSKETILAFLINQGVSSK
jgi:DNA repair exonuclease SbcCD nuclease subunit